MENLDFFINQFSKKPTKYNQGGFVAFPEIWHIVIFLRHYIIELMKKYKNLELGTLGQSIAHSKMTANERK